MISASFRRSIQGAVAAGDAAAGPLAGVPWVAQWKFNNNGNDSVGANNLTNNNSATFTTGKLGGATGATQLVAASTQYWSIASSTFQIDAAFLIAAWVNTNSNTTAQEIIAKDTNSGTREYTLEFAGRVAKRISFVINPGASGGFLDSGTDLAANVWHLVVAWYDPNVGVSGTMYLNINNGSTISKALAAVPITGATELRVGSRVYAGYQWYFDGLIDNVCIAKGAGAVPSQAVLDALWNGGAGTELLT